MPKPHMGGLNPDGTPLSGTLPHGTHKLFLGKDPYSNNFSEAQIQMFIIQEARRAGYIITGSMEQGLRSKGSGGRAKACGMTAGMPDMLIWRQGGKLKTIELKTTEGKLSPAQIEFHGVLRRLGYSVDVVFAESPMDGWNKVKGIIECHG